MLEAIYFRGEKCAPAIILLMLSIFLFNTNSWSQEEKVDKMRPKFGIAMKTTFSRVYANGIGPALTVDLGQHQISLGPRFEFPFLQGKSNFYYNDFIMDLNYRFYFLKNSKAIKPYGLFSTELLHNRHSHTRYYDPTEPIYSTAGPPPTLDHAFWVHSSSSSYDLNFRLGAGIETPLFKGLYFGAEYAYGVQGIDGKVIYSDANTGEFERKDKSRYRIWGLGYIASAGIGYRF